MRINILSPTCNPWLWLQLSQSITVLANIWPRQTIPCPVKNVSILHFSCLNAYFTFYSVFFKWKMSAFLHKVHLEQNRALTWLLKGPNEHQPQRTENMHLGHPCTNNNWELSLPWFALAFYTSSNKVLSSLKPHWLKCYDQTCKGGRRYKGKLMAPCF